MKGSLIVLLCLLLSACATGDKRSPASNGSFKPLVIAHKESEPSLLQEWTILCADEKVNAYLRDLFTSAASKKSYDVDYVDVNENGTITIGYFPYVFIQPSAGCVVNQFKSEVIRNKNRNKISR